MFEICACNLTLSPFVCCSSEAVWFLLALNQAELVAELLDAVLRGSELRVNALLRARQLLVILVLPAERLLLVLQLRLHLGHNLLALLYLGLPVGLHPGDELALCSITCSL